MQAGVKIGKRLVALMEEKGLTPTELAKKAKMDQPGVSNLMSDRRRAGPTSLRRLAKAFKVSTEELLNGKAPRNDAPTTEPIKGYKLRAEVNAVRAIETELQAIQNCFGAIAAIATGLSGK